MMKKLICILLLINLMLVFVSCGPENDSQSAEDNSTNREQNESSDADPDTKPDVPPSFDSDDGTGTTLPMVPFR